MTEISFTASTSAGQVSALLERPRDATYLLVLAHGAGAPMRHRFMSSVATRLHEQQIATFRYQFPYMEQQRMRPDPSPILMATVRSALAAARMHAGDLPLLAGGKSMGGRMTSMAVAKEPIAEVRGLVFFGFPLHGAAKRGTERAEHLSAVKVPMLFLQGTRDNLADLELLRPVCAGLGSRAHLHVLEGADHSFHVLKRSGRTDEEVLDELALTASQWIRKTCGSQEDEKVKGER